MKSNYTTKADKVAVQGRKAGRQETMIRDLRKQIVAGKFTLGSQLPNQVELAKEFGVSVVTAQLALRQLGHEGFLDITHRQGRFVSKNPPHLSRYGLVFSNSPEPIMNMPTWSRYYQTLSAECLHMQQLGLDIKPFYGVGVSADSNAVRQIEELVTSDRLAGLIFVNVPPCIQEMPIVKSKGFPRLVLDAYRSPEVVPVSMDRISWVKKAADIFAARKCRKIALISFRSFLEEDGELFDGFEEAGISIPAYMRQSLNPLDPKAVKTYVQLLLRLPPGERPDGLLIGDDNLVEGAMAGLVAAGVRTPDDLMVVAYANFPNIPATPLPVHFLGFDVRTKLRISIECIDSWRRGKRPTQELIVPAQEKADIANDKFLQERKNVNATRSSYMWN